MIAGMLDRIERQARRMGLMMERLQVDAVELARSRRGADFVKARGTCGACRNTEVCEVSHAAWQASRADGPNPMDFCPNARLFAEFRARG